MKHWCCAWVNLAGRRESIGRRGATIGPMPSLHLLPVPVFPVAPSSELPIRTPHILCMIRSLPRTSVRPCWIISVCRQTTNSMISSTGLTAQPPAGVDLRFSADLTPTAHVASDQFFHQLNSGRAYQNYENAGEDEQYERKNHLYRRLLSFLFGHLTTLDSHRVRLDSQCLSN